jgi:hypothetical protein
MDVQLSLTRILKVGNNSLRRIGIGIPINLTMLSYWISPISTGVGSSQSRKRGSWEKSDSMATVLASH